MAKVKKERLKENLKIRLAQLLHKEAADPRLEGVTISSLKLSPDGALATCFFSIFGKTPEEVQKIEAALNHSSGFFQRRLGQVLESRNTPRLHFVFDKGFDYSNQIEDVLIRLKKEGELS